MSTAGEAEEILIHFTHARKVQGKARNEVPRSHNALNVRDYLDRITAGAPGVLNAYAQLCDLTHPGASSVLSFAAAEEQESYVDVILHTKQERVVVKELRDQLEPVMDDVLQMGMNGSLVTLKLLHTFDLRAVQTPYAMNLNLDAIPLWTKTMATMPKR